MRLVLSKECEVLTTPKIMEKYYPELWERVCNQEARLRNIQYEIKMEYHHQPHLLSLQVSPPATAPTRSYVGG